jgi:molybdopterin-guanine dinucleotide biosynthesis protein A
MMRATALFAGYVLAGGKSRRMGTDKAMLPFGGLPLGAWVARRLQQVCGNVAVVGEPAKYSGWGFRVIEDIFPAAGPLGGIHAALSDSKTELNLIVGCDMPYVTPEFLEFLLGAAAAADVDGVVPASAAFGYEPLCAVYKRSCLVPMECALRAGRRRISEVFPSLRLRTVPPAEWHHYDQEGRLLQNLNTRDEYERACRELLTLGCYRQGA